MTHQWDGGFQVKISPSLKTFHPRIFTSKFLNLNLEPSSVGEVVKTKFVWSLLRTPKIFIFEGFIVNFFRIFLWIFGKHAPTKDQKIFFRVRLVWVLEFSRKPNLRLGLVLVVFVVVVALKIQQYCNRPRDRNNFEQLEKRRTVTRTADVRKKGHYSVQGFIVQSTRLSLAVKINLET